MVLSRGDEYPIHQTAEPVAYSGTDRNFYDRYFFNGYAPKNSFKVMCTCLFFQLRRSEEIQPNRHYNR